MAVKIRLRRMGSNKNAFYRIVVADNRAPRDGRFIEEIGYYDPVKEPKNVKIDMERAQEWIKNGAQPTPTVGRLLKEYKVTDSEEVETEKVEEAKEEVEAEEA